MKEGKIIVISGPSGAGKKSVIDTAKKKFGFDAVLSVSATTRKPRPGEKDKVDYNFLTKDEFEQCIKNDEFVEWVTFANNYYGTLKKNINDITKKGKNVYLEIEVKGAEKIMKNRKDNMVFIFICAPSIDDLESRLRKRRTETSDEIMKRLEISKTEMKKKELYDYVVVNNDLEVAAKKVVSIIKK